MRFLELFVQNYALPFEELEELTNTSNCVHARVVGKMAK